jgi:Pyruvate/2-oxoacid:ferredoxin oxidoreductase delta subunit
MWFVKLLMKAFPNIKVIAKLTRVPLLGKIMDKLLFDGDDIIYLAKDKVIAVNSEVDEQIDAVLPSQVLEYFINKSNYRWVMNFCICRSSMSCEDYPTDLGCLFLGEAVKDINPQLGKMVSKEEALDHIKKCRDAGLVHMIGRNLLDKQWLGVDPGYKLLSICNCCPCCCLWRISPLLNPEIGRKVTKMPGVEVKVSDKCIGCGTCTNGVCFVDAISLKNDKAVISKECRGCGRCVETCPQNAIQLTVEDNMYVKKSIERLDKIVDVT